MISFQVGNNMRLSPMLLLLSVAACAAPQPQAPAVTKIMPVTTGPNSEVSMAGTATLYSNGHVTLVGNPPAPPNGGNAVPYRCLWELAYTSQIGSVPDTLSNPTPTLNATVDGVASIQAFVGACRTQLRPPPFTP